MWGIMVQFEEISSFTFYIYISTDPRQSHSDECLRLFGSVCEAGEAVM